MNNKYLSPELKKVIEERFAKLDKEYMGYVYHMIRLDQMNDHAAKGTFMADLNHNSPNVYLEDREIIL